MNNNLLVNIKNIDELRQWLKEAEKQPKDPSLKSTCICGNCLKNNTVLTEEQLQELFELLNKE